MSSSKPIYRSPWKERIATIVLTALVTALLTVYVPGLVDKLSEKRPDTTIYQYVTTNGPSVLIDNRGEATDRVKIEIRTYDTIVDFHVSESTSVKLVNGGPGNNFARFTIDELWPRFPQYIDITTSSPTKVAADTVFGYSLFEGDVEEEIPVVKPRNH